MNVELRTPNYERRKRPGLPSLAGASSLAVAVIDRGYNARLAKRSKFSLSAFSLPISRLPLANAPFEVRRSKFGLLLLRRPPPANASFDVRSAVAPQKLWRTSCSTFGLLLHCRLPPANASFEVRRSKFILFLPILYSLKSSRSTSFPWLTRYSTS